MSSLKELESYIYDKINLIKQQSLIYDYIDGENDVKDILRLQEEMFELKTLVKELKDLRQKDLLQIEEMKLTNERLLELNQIVCKQLESKQSSNYIKPESSVKNKKAENSELSVIKKIPVKIKSGYLTPEECDSDDDLMIPSFDDIKKNSPHFLFYELEHITMREFVSIPKYMKDEKITIEKLNWAIDELNKARTKKYTILATTKKKMNERICSLIREYKDQEIKATQNIPFVIEKDLNSFCNFKLDKAGHKFMTIFRHCKRIKEIRGNNLTRYAFL